MLAFSLRGEQKVFEVDVLHPVSGLSEGVVEAIDRLNPGDIVRLDWQHADVCPCDCGTIASLAECVD